MADSLIELGVPQADVVGRWRRPRGRRPSGWLVALAALAVLLSVIASAPQAAVGFHPLWTAAAGTYGVEWGAGVLYVTETGAESVAARDASTGQLRWRLTVGRPVQFVFDIGHGVLGVAIQADEAVQALGHGADGSVVLVAADTGRVIATVVGQLWRAEDRYLLLVRAAPTCPELTTCLTAVRVDVATGAVVAQAALSGDEITVAEPGEGSGVADIRATSATVRSGTDFSVQTELDLPSPGAHSRRSALYQDRLVTAEQRESDVLISSYPLGPAGRPWTLALPAPIATTNGYLYLDACGRFVCLHLTDSIAVIDRDTGTLARRLPQDFFVATPDLSGLMLGLAGPGTTGESVDVFVLRTTDATVTARLRHTGIVTWTDSGGRGLALQEAHDRTQFLSIDARDGVHVLGSVPGHGLDCRARGQLLACETVTGQVSVWRFP